MESKLWVVIPAAGDSRRFREAGYATPKPFLKVQRIEGAPGYMLEFVLNSVAGFPEYVIALRNDTTIPPNFRPYARIHRIESTKGQADTVFQVVSELPKDDSVLVLDCDMILRQQDTARIIDLLESYDTVIAVAETFDPNASRVDSIPHPTRFVEKEPISQWGIVGARAFKNAGHLTGALNRTLERYATIGREPYLSVAINYVPGTKVTHLVTDFVDLGTPERIRESGWKIIPN